MIEQLESRLFLSRTWFVATNGNDKNPGTIGQPFRTIQHAALLALAGDTVDIRGGTYRETVTPAHSGTSSAPITYAAYGNEVVTIDGADPLSGWTRNANSNTIYSTPQPWDLGTGNNQVFVDGVAMNEAAWPNTAVGAIQPSTASITSVYSSALGQGYLYAQTATISVSGLPGGVGAWNGATIEFGGGQSWVIQSGTVLSSGNGSLTFAYQHQTGYETPVAGNRFYLTGKFIGLDAAGEWYRDPTTGRLNLWTSNGTSPATHLVEAKRGQFAFELSGLSYVHLSNIHIFAASIDTNAASHNLLINNIAASYVSQQMLNPIGWVVASTTGLVINGTNNILQNSTINRSSGNGVYLGGSNNIVQNCTITNTDYCGADYAGVTMGGVNNQVLHSVIHDTGRDGIRDTFSYNARIEYNTLYNIGHQTTDLGAIYSHGTDSHGTVIAFNNISNIHSGGFGAAGVYLDNGCADFVVHDNVLTNVQLPIKLNPPSYSNSVLNNTINGKVVANSSSGGGSPAASPITYHGSSSTLTSLGTLGGFTSDGLDVNNLGTVVGRSFAAASSPVFIFSNNTLSPVHIFGVDNDRGNSINDSGQIAGQAFNSSDHDIAFLDSGGKITSLGTLPGDSTSRAYAINSSGQIAGASFGTDSVSSAFLYSGGKMTSLGTLGGSISQAFGINDGGVVVGSSAVAGNRDSHAFSWAAGAMHDLGTLGGSSSYALGINNAGQVVGASRISGNGAFHAFIVTGGSMKDLGTLAGFKNSVALGINSAGEVVGYAYNSDTGASRGFLYRNGIMTDLTALLPANTGLTVGIAQAINDHDQITGTLGGQAHAYLLTLLS